MWLKGREQGGMMMDQRVQVYVKGSSEEGRRERHGVWES